MTATIGTGMQYQVTCVCGHRFFLPEESLGKPVPCPTCNRPLMPVAKDAAAPPAPSAAEATKRCPFCGEIILAVARKCRFCNEFLDRTAPSAAAPPSQEQADLERQKREAEAAPVFILSVSQWDNFFRFIICLSIAIATGFVLHVFKSPYEFPATMGVTVLMMFLIYWFYLAAKSAKCTIRPARLETETGILSKQTDTLELWRVIDIQLKQSALERILGIGTIYLRTAEEGSPLIELYQIPRARKVFKYLQEQVPVMAKERGVVYIEK